MAGAAIPDVYAPPMPASALGNTVKTFLQMILDITKGAPPLSGKHWVSGKYRNIAYFIEHHGNVAIRNRLLSNAYM